MFSVVSFNVTSDEVMFRLRGTMFSVVSFNVTRDEVLFWSRGIMFSVVVFNVTRDSFVCGVREWQGSGGSRWLSR